MLAARLGERGAPLAARLPLLHGPVCEQLLESFSRRNGLVAGIANADMSYARDLPKAVPGMANYLKSNLTPPLQIDSSGKIQLVHRPGEKGK